jgi:AcrR family transcriptional regulator
VTHSIHPTPSEAAPSRAAGPDAADRPAMDAGVESAVPRTLPRTLASADGVDTALSGQPNVQAQARVSSSGKPKGRQTRAAILDAALGLAAHMGLEGLSIGALAELMQMSKSGVFAHFGSREELQISVIREYHRRFEDEVFFSAMTQPRGLPRLSMLFENWVRRVSHELDSGCIYISGAVEFDDRPGPVRDALAEMVRAWHAALGRAIALAVDTGELRPDTDAAQMLFEIHGLILALHHDARFLRQPGVLDRARRGFEHVLERYRAADGEADCGPASRAEAGRASPTRRPATR